MKKIYLLTALILFYCVQIINAQPVTLDPTFGQDGIATFPKGAITHFDFDKYGNIIAAGRFESLLKGYWGELPMILKTDPNGNPDKNFGNNGQVILYDGFTENWEIYGLKITTDNKILLIITSYPDEIPLNEEHGTWMIKFNEDGSFDNSYGNNGKIFLEPITYIFAIDLSRDDYFITLNGDEENEFVLKHNYNGEMDSTFGDNGKVYLTDNKTFLIFPECVKILSDQSIIVAGYDYFKKINVRIQQLAFFKLTPNGNFDTNFANNGILIIESDLVGSKIFDNVMEDADGALVLTGNNNANTTNNNRFICRFNSNGTIDNSFGENGFFYYKEISSSIWRKTLLQNGDKYLIGEIRTIYSFNHHGTADTSFNNTGTFWLGPDSYFFHNMKLQNSNKIIVGGMDFSFNMIMARINILQDNSIKPNDNIDIINIYPNPAKDYLYFSNETPFEIFDIYGRKQKAESRKQNAVDISNLNAGIYFIKFGDNNRVLKFVKQ